jgi:hypothetical protein
MRAVLPLLLLLLLLPACQREPSFDERYAKAEKSIRDKAHELDADLAKREKAAREAEAAVAGASTDPPRAGEDTPATN